MVFNSSLFHFCWLIILSYGAVSRPCRLLEFYPNRTSLIAGTPFRGQTILKRKQRIYFTQVSINLFGAELLICSIMNWLRIVSCSEDRDDEQPRTLGENEFNHS